MKMLEWLSNSSNNISDAYKIKDNYMDENTRSINLDADLIIRVSPFYK